MFSYVARYCVALSTGRRVLWSYFIWYVFFVARYFEAKPGPWMTAFGLSALIGVALFINTTASGRKPVKLERWPIIRLFLFPFCVSSFSAMVKGHDFIFVFSRKPYEDLAALGACALLWIAVAVAKMRIQHGGAEGNLKH